VEAEGEQAERSDGSNRRVFRDGYIGWVGGEHRRSVFRHCIQWAISTVSRTFCLRGKSIDVR
jgi:hypothetical protein